MPLISFQVDTKSDPQGQRLHDLIHANHHYQSVHLVRLVLVHALAVAGDSDGPSLIHAVGAMDEPAPPRSTLTMAANARRFARWASARLPAPGGGVRLL